MVAYRPFLIPVLTDGSVGRRDAAQGGHRKMGSSRALCLGCLALLPLACHVSLLAGFPFYYFFLIHLFLKALSGDAVHRRSEETAEPEVSEEKLADWAMSLHVTLLMVTFLGGYWLSNIEFKYLGESGFGLIVGASFCVPILHGGGLLGVSRRE